MHETPEDIAALQDLLDRSRAGAGEHLLRIFREDWRIDAAELAPRLGGVQILHLATVTRAGEPRVGPVDGLFFRGAFHFGSAPDSLRAGNIRARPAVSGSIAHGEELGLIVHGRAVEFDFDAPEQEALRGYYREVYGEGWDGFRRGNPYWRIAADRMYAFAR
jgi:hypothetical protein